MIGKQTDSHRKGEHIKRKKGGSGKGAIAHFYELADNTNTYCGTAKWN